MNLHEILQQRYATKKFDGKTIPQEKIDELLEIIRLAPSSFGLQPFQVYVVTNKELKAQLEPAAFGQPQITSCSHLLVFCADTKVMERIDEYEQMMISAGSPKDKASGYGDVMRGSIKGKSEKDILVWSQKQCYIALENALLGAKELGFDSCPMEGFSKEDFDKILSLPGNLKSTVLCPVGYAADTPKPKLRYSKEKLFRMVE